MLLRICYLAFASAATVNEDLAGREPTCADSVPCLRHTVGCSTGAHRFPKSEDTRSGFKNDIAVERVLLSEEVDV